MKILVTGGAGFIGSHLVRRLAEPASHKVLVFDNLRRGSTEALRGLRERVSFHVGDIRDRVAVEEVMRGCDLVYHLAAQSNVMGGEDDPDYSFSTNVAGTYHVLRAAADCGVGRLVFPSSREVYGDPDCVPVPEAAPLRPKNAYGASKVAGEMYCRVERCRGTDVRVLRLANVYGPGDRDRVIPIFIERALGALPLTIYGGGQVLDFVWIGTVVDALIQAGTCGDWSEPVNVGSGTGTAIEMLAERILSLTGSASRVEVAPVRSAEVTRFIADISKARDLLALRAAADPLAHLEEVMPWSRPEPGPAR